MVTFVTHSPSFAKLHCFKLKNTLSLYDERISDKQEEISNKKVQTIVYLVKIFVLLVVKDFEL